MTISKTTPFTKEEIEKQQLFILSQLALDLKRSAIGSERVRGIFLNQFSKSKKLVGINNFSNYIKKILDMNFLNTDKENLLMYSTILQNYARSN